MGHHQHQHQAGLEMDTHMDIEQVDYISDCGFMSSVFFRNPTSGFCLLFPGTNIDSDAKYTFAVFAVLVLGFASQVASAKIEKFKARGNTSIQSIVQRGVAFCAQITLQYLNMLVVMSFNVGIFFALIVGKVALNFTNRGLNDVYPCVCARARTGMDVPRIHSGEHSNRQMLRLSPCSAVAVMGFVEIDGGNLIRHVCATYSHNRFRMMRWLAVNASDKSAASSGAMCAAVKPKSEPRILL